MTDQADFDRAVDKWVSEALTQPSDWAALLYRLPSIYPPVVLESAKRLSLLHMIRFPNSGQIATQASFATGLWSKGELLTPHPQDASWWFGDFALQRLIELIRSAPVREGGLLLLGTPTLFHFARQRAIRQDMILLDKECSVGVYGPHRSFRVDLLKQHPSCTEAAVIVADPPWYSSEMQAFLWTARQNATKGSTVMLSVPPAGTRPGVQREWDTLLSWAEGVGLRLVDYKIGILPYVSPLFERNALLAAGVGSYPMDWRRGDLAIFSCDRAVEPLDEFVPCSPDEKWHEVMFGQVRFRFRVGGHAAWEKPMLGEIVPGDVLPSVSRRDKRRESVGAWTSGNRTFRCFGPFIVRKIAEAVAKDECPVSSIESYLQGKLETQQRYCVEQTVGMLRNIIEIEEKEIKDWKNELNENVVELPAHQG